MPVIKRPGASVSYDVVGKGPPVLLGHSLLCTNTMWSGVLDAIKSDYRFINIDLRGHGASTANSPFTVDDLVDDWIAILDQESIERAILCGLSTGGMTAMRLALKNPDRVLGLALLDTNAAAEDPGVRRKYLTLAWLYRRFGLMPRRTLVNVMFGPKTIASRPDLVSHIVATARAQDKDGIGHAMRAVWSRDGVDLSPISQPTIVIVGEHDAGTPPFCARAIARTVDGAELHIIPDAGHLTAVEQPQTVAALLEPFFIRCSENSRP